MNTVTEDYVSLEVAKLLKEKGFNEDCYTYYDDINDSINRFDKGYYFNNTSYPWGVPYDINKEKKYVVAPTLQMVCKWLRKIYNIDILPQVYYLHVKCYRCMITNGVETFTLQEPKFLYEEAVEIAIKYSLENLI